MHLLAKTVALVKLQNIYLIEAVENGLAPVEVVLDLMLFVEVVDPKLLLPDIRIPVSICGHSEHKIGVVTCFKTRFRLKPTF